MTNSTLNELLKDNFDNYQVLWNNRRYHTHNAHHLGSLALLGADDEQLKEIYENTMRHYTTEYETSPHEITNENWYDSLGDRRFCSAYRDFFIKELSNDKDWKKTFFQILLDDTKGPPLINGAFCDLLHPIIHMDYAIELNNQFVACEALTIAAVCIDAFHQITTELSLPTNPEKSALEIMKDIRLDDYVPKINEPVLLNHVLTHQTLLLSHYNQWKMAKKIDKTIEELFDMSVYVYGATHKPNQIDFDFVLLHLVTGINALRKLRPYLDDKTTTRLASSFFYLSLAVYIAQRQPKINESFIDDFQIDKEKSNWDYVVKKTLSTKRATEVHFVKVIRALKDADKDYGSKNGFYLKMAVKSVDYVNVNNEWDYYKTHEPWIGFPGDERELNIKH